MLFGRGSALPRLAMAMAGEGDDGGGSSSGGGNGAVWSDGLPENIRSWDEVKNSDSPEKFWDQMSNMRSRMGASIRIPSEDAGQEDIAEFHEKLKSKVPGLMPTPDFDNDEALQDLYGRMGRPETPADYAIPEVKDVAGNVVTGLDMTLAEDFKELAHKAGLNQSKYAEIVTAITQNSINKVEELRQAQKVDSEKLAGEWGHAFDQNSKIVENFISKTGAPKSLIDAMNNGLMDSTTKIWLHKLATQTVGSKADFQSDTSNSNVMTPDEAAIKISEIRNNKEHPYNNKKDPGHKAAMSYMRELYLLKNPKSGKNPAPGTQF